MTKKEALEKISAFRDITERARQVANIVCISDDFCYVTDISFGVTEFFVRCEDYDDNFASSYNIPIEYLWMSDSDIVKDHQRRRYEKKREENLRKEEEMRVAARKAEKEERELYDRLREKYGDGDKS